MLKNIKIKPTKIKITDSFEHIEKEITVDKLDDLNELSREMFKMFLISGGSKIHIYKD
jgi:hypothetical protein